MYMQFLPSSKLSTNAKSTKHEVLIKSDIYPSCTLKEQSITCTCMFNQIHIVHVPYTSIITSLKRQK